MGVRKKGENTQECGHPEKVLRRWFEWPLQGR